jgi:NADPH:quinone reductase-like Zn-dependent oxidoreductase
LPRTFKLREVEKPTPGDDQVLVRVYASSVNFANLALIRGRPFVIRLRFGFLRPKEYIPGSDVAGRVEAVGKEVMEFQPGDEVYGDITSDDGYGAYAEYVAVRQAIIALKPANLSFAEAAAVPQAAAVALQGLRMGGIQEGQKVLICGASGGIGTFAVQIAKAFGAHVTAVCSTRNVDLVRSIGADQIIDYKREDFSRRAERYDLILATVGYRPIADYQRVLSPEGHYVVTGGTMRQILDVGLHGERMSARGGQTFSMLEHQVSQDDLVFIKEVIEAGKVKPVLDKCYPLEAAADALRYYGKRRTRGKVVITVEHDDKA